MKIFHDYKFTFEVIMVASFVALFLFFLHLRPELFSAGDMDINLIETLKYDSQFRACIASNDNACIQDRVSFLLQERPFRLRILRDFKEQLDPSSLPGTFVEEEMFIAGNSSAYEPALIKVYYWDR